MQKLLVDAKIIYKGKELLISALVDTGNNLKDPLSNKSIFVVELSKLLTMLPEELIEFYKIKKYTKIEDLLLKLSDEFPLILVPFKSIGNEKGIILGFKPDNVIIRFHNETQEIQLDRIIIGIYNGHLSNEREFSGLIDYDSVIEKEEIWLN